MYQLCGLGHRDELRRVTYKQGESLLVLRDLLFGQRIGLEECDGAVSTRSCRTAPLCGESSRLSNPGRGIIGEDHSVPL